MKCKNCDKDAHYTPLVLVWAKGDDKRERAVSRIEIDYPLCQEHADEIGRNPALIDCTGDALVKLTADLKKATKAYWDLCALENAAGKASHNIPDDVDAAVAAIEPDLENKKVQFYGNHKRPLPFSLAYLRLPKGYQNPIVARAMSLAFDVTQDALLASAVAVRFYNIPEEQRMRGKGRIAKKILADLQEADVDLEAMIEEEVKVRA